MTAPLLPRPKSFVITLDGSSGPGEGAFLDLFRCRRCNHDLGNHGPAGAAPPSKSRCQLTGCDCARFMRDGDED